MAVTSIFFTTSPDGHEYHPRKLEPRAPSIFPPKIFSTGNGVAMSNVSLKPVYTLMCVVVYVVSRDH